MKRNREGDIFAMDKTGRIKKNKDGSCKLTTYGKAWFRVLQRKENKKIK